MNIFLIPAREENFRETLQKTVSFDDAVAYLDQSAVAELKNTVDGPKQFNCWAMSDEKAFARMSRGDLLLFTLTATNRFGWFGEVGGKITSAELGNHLWPFQKDKPWKFIYVVRNLGLIDVDKRLLLNWFGYTNPKDDLAGTRSVHEKGLVELIDRFRSLEGFLKALRVGFGELGPPLSAAVERKYHPKKPPQAKRYSALDALKEVVKSGQYKAPAPKLIPELEAQVTTHINTAGMTPLDAARQVLAQFQKPKSDD